MRQTVADEIHSLKRELAYIEDDLIGLENEGIYEGDEYDSLRDEAIRIEQELRGLSLLDEDEEI